MTTMVQDIDAALKTLLPAGGVYVSVNTGESGKYPYIVFQRVVSSDNVGLSGPSNVQNARIQVDVFDRTYSGAEALAAQARAVLLSTFSSFPRACVPLTSFDVYEELVKAHRVSADYSIWATN